MNEWGFVDYETLAALGKSATITSSAIVPAASQFIMIAP